MKINRMSRDSRRRLLLSMSGGMLLLPLRGWANTAFPDKPVKVVVPFPPGGTVDTVTRLLSNQLANQLGQPVVIDNKGGAGGTIGARLVSQAPADGYTILLTASNQVINPLILKTVPYNLDKDFTPICYIGYVPQLVLVNAESPAKTFEEFVAMVKAKPGGYNWATSGLGTAGHLAEELINITGDLKMPVVPYRGGGPALMDLMANHVSAMVEPIPSALPHVKGGRLRALAVTSPVRAASLPDVPTVAESGMPGFELPSWYGVWGPANMDPAVVNKIYDSFKRTLQSTDVVERLNELSFVVVADPPGPFANFIQKETEKYSNIVKTAGIVIDG